METAQCLAVLLLAPVLAMMGTSPVNVPDCTESVRKDQDVKVFYTTSRVASGCVSRGPTDTNLDVHVLYLTFFSSIPGSISNVYFNVSMPQPTGNRKTVFVVHCDVFCNLTINTEDCRQDHCHLSIISGSQTQLNRANNKTVLPFSSEGLLNWAKTTFGGVSSFTDLESPQWIRFQVGRELSSIEDCVPQQNFNAEQYLETEIISQNIKSCQGSDGKPQKEAHIVWLQDSSIQTVDTNIKVTCNDKGPANELPLLLMFKSHDSLVWNMNQMPQLGGFLVSGKYHIKINGFEPVGGIALPDTKEGLIQVARNYSAFIASYTEIPSAKSITLELVRICAGQKTVATAKPEDKVSGMTNIFQTLIHACKPWRCLDSGIKIALSKNDLKALSSIVTEVTLQDPSCRATENTTHFVLESLLESCSTHLEGGIFANNELVLTLSSYQEKVTVPFQCDLPEKVSLQLYHTPDFTSSPSTTVEVNKATYVQVSARTADPNAIPKTDSCFLKTADQSPPQLLTLSHIGLSDSEESMDSPRPKIHRFSFIYETKEQWATSSATLVCKVSLDHQPHQRSFESSLEVTLQNDNTSNQGLSIGSVLGITFGAFLIGVLLTAALWYIYSHTRPMAKMQPVSVTLPASESSSTNHSIGSTQSTPCSTSSMA